MKTLSKSMIGMTVAVATMVGTAFSAKASSGPDYFYDSPGQYSYLRAYYDYLTLTTRYGYDFADTMAVADELYAQWSATAPNYALSLYYDGVASANYSYYDDYIDSVIEYYKYTGLWYYYYYASQGNISEGENLYDDYFDAAYEFVNPYYGWGSDASESYGYNYSYNSSYGGYEPTGYADYYAYYFDVFGQ